MIALLLAPIPLALGALALALLRPLGRAERAVVACAAVAFAICAVFSPAAPMRDAWTHFEHLRLSLSEPRRLLDPWDRPGFMLLYAAPAALGIAGARLASLVPAAIALAATMRAARALGLPRPWAAGLLLVAQYDFFGQASSTMTELPFAAALAIAAWGWAEERPWVVAAGAAWCAVTRPEGPLFAAIFAAGLALRWRRVAPAAAAFAPLALWVVANALVWSDPLWWIHGNPYDGKVAPRLELRQLADSYFYEALRQGQPPVLILLEAAGAVVALSARGRALRFLLAPVLVSFLLLTFLKIGPTDAWRESRYLVSVAPALALLAAAGLDGALAASPALAAPVLLALAALGGARELLWNWRTAVAGVPWIETATHASLYAAAALLWAFRRHLPTRVALGVLLAIPLACSPPGALSRHRVEASLDPGTNERQPEAIVSDGATSCGGGMPCARAPRADAVGRVP